VPVKFIFSNSIISESLFFGEQEKYLVPLRHGNGREINSGQWTTCWLPGTACGEAMASMDANPGRNPQSLKEKPTWQFSQGVDAP
jgi:hypothetical protein